MAGPVTTAASLLLLALCTHCILPTGEIPSLCLGLWAGQAWGRGLAGLTPQRVEEEAAWGSCEFTGCLGHELHRKGFSFSLCPISDSTVVSPSPCCITFVSKKIPEENLVSYQLTSRSVCLKEGVM